LTSLLQIIIIILHYFPTSPRRISWCLGLIVSRLLNWSVCIWSCSSNPPTCHLKTFIKFLFGFMFHSIIKIDKDEQFWIFHIKSNTQLIEKMWNHIIITGKFKWCYYTWKRHYDVFFLYIGRIQQDLILSSWWIELFSWFKWSDDLYLLTKWFWNAIAIYTKNLRIVRFYWYIIRFYIYVEKN